MKLHGSRSLVLGFVAVFALLSTPAFAKLEFAKKEKEPCATCHIMSKLPMQNEVGECYKRHGYKNLAACKKDPSAHRVHVPEMK